MSFCKGMKQPLADLKLLQPEKKETASHPFLWHTPEDLKHVRGRCTKIARWHTHKNKLLFKKKKKKGCIELSDLCWDGKIGRQNPFFLIGCSTRLWRTRTVGDSTSWCRTVTVGDSTSLWRTVTVRESISWWRTVTLGDSTSLRCTVTVGESTSLWHTVTLGDSTSLWHTVTVLESTSLWHTVTLGDSSSLWCTVTVHESTSQWRTVTLPVQGEDDGIQEMAMLTCDQGLVPLDGTDRAGQGWLALRNCASWWHGQSRARLTCDQEACGYLVDTQQEQPLLILEWASRSRQQTEARWRPVFKRCCQGRSRSMTE